MSKITNILADYSSHRVRFSTSDGCKGVAFVCQYDVDQPLGVLYADRNEDTLYEYMELDTWQAVDPSEPRIHFTVEEVLDDHP